MGCNTLDSSQSTLIVQANTIEHRTSTTYVIDGHIALHISNVDVKLILSPVLVAHIGLRQGNLLGGIATDYLKHSSSSVSLVTDGSLVVASLRYWDITTNGSLFVGTHVQASLTVIVTIVLIPRIAITANHILIVEVLKLILHLTIICRRLCWHLDNRRGNIRILQLARCRSTLAIDGQLQRTVVLHINDELRVLPFAGNSTCRVAGIILPREGWFCRGTHYGDGIYLLGILWEFGIIRQSRISLCIALAIFQTIVLHIEAQLI